MGLLRLMTAMLCSGASVIVSNKPIVSNGGRAANRFLAAIAGGQNSVPIKSWSALHRTAHLLRPSPNKPVPKPTPRMAKAIAASAIASGVLLQAGAELPRRLVINTVECAIENNCGGDMITAGLVAPFEPRIIPL